MILVADSGSTKCDWLILNGAVKTETKTMGFNPFFHSAGLIHQALKSNPDLASIARDVDAIYFYGAGCSSAERNAIVENALKQTFPHATQIVVDHDLTGAALATCSKEKGIACIVGTGSNSCYFDGEKAMEAVPALGYVLGDEGSGSYFGKIILSNYLYKRLPSELSNAFEKRYDLSKEIIFSRVYNEPNPNVYLASFMKFVSDHRDHPYFKDMIYRGLSVFADIHISCYEGYRNVPVHFVGSIAYYFKEVLDEVAKNMRFKIGEVIKKPIYPLAEHHAFDLTNS